MFPHGWCFQPTEKITIVKWGKGGGAVRGSSEFKTLCTAIKSFQIYMSSVGQLFIVECFGIFLSNNSCSQKIPKHWQACVFTLKSSTFLCLPGSEHCFRNFTAATGLIESPDFPDKYPHNLECSYIIIAPPQTEVTLTFKTFDLENDPLLMTEAECKYDWLEVWDGLPQGELLNE